MSKYWKRIRNGLGITIAVGALFLLLYKILEHPEETLAIFNEANKLYWPILFILQIFSFFLTALLLKTLLSFNKTEVSFWQNLKVAVANKFGNSMLPIAGGPVASYLIYRSINIPSSAIIFTTTVQTSLNFLQYVIFFLISLILIPKSFIDLIPKLGIMALAMVFVFCIIFLVLILKKESRNSIKKIFIWVTDKINNIFSLPFEIKDLNEKIESVGKKITDQIRLLFSNPKRALAAVFLSAIYFSSDVAMLYFSFKSFGIEITPALTIFGFILSLLLSLITLIPGNPGVMEASISLVFNLLGIPLHGAVLAVILFRVASYWVWVPLSLYFTLEHRRSKKLKV